MAKKPNHNLLSLKTVIRTRDFEASKSFYVGLLNLEIVEEYDDGNGSRGLILRFGDENSNAFIEISEILESHDYYQPPFSKAIENDKLDIQLKTNDIGYWANLLKEKQWPFRGRCLVLGAPSIFI